eukprot:gene4629-5071_t
MSSEQLRLQTLRETKLLDSDRHDVDFDRYTRLAARIFKTPIALITLIDGQHAWIKSAVGFSAPAVPRELAICARLIPDSTQQPILTVENTLQDCRFCHLPAVTVTNGLRFYAGAVILCQGRKLGTLCVLDYVPHDDFDEAKQCLLSELAQLVSFLVEKRRARAVEQEEEVARIIVGGIHHLKSPLREVNASFASIIVQRRRLGELCRQTIRNEVVIDENMKQLLQTTNFFLLQVQHLAEEIEIGINLVSAFYRAKSSGPSKCSAKCLSFQPGVKVQLAGQVDWEFCKVLQFGEVAVDVLRLSTVFSSIATLAANECEKMQVLISVEKPLTNEASLPIESVDEITVAPQMRMPSQKGGSLCVVILALKPLQPHKLGRRLSPLSLSRVVEGGDFSSLSEEVVAACTVELCSTILSALGGTLSCDVLESNSPTERQVLKFCFELPCRFRVSKEMLTNGSSSKSSSSSSSALISFGRIRFSLQSPAFTRLFASSTSRAQQIQAMAQRQQELLAVDGQASATELEEFAGQPSAILANVATAEMYFHARSDDEDNSSFSLSERNDDSRLHSSKIADIVPVEATPSFCSYRSSPSKIAKPRENVFSAAIRHFLSLFFFKNNSVLPVSDEQ